MPRIFLNAHIARPLMLLLLLLVASFRLAGATEQPLSPAALVADKAGAKLYIAEATAGRIAVFDLAREGVTETIPLPGAVEQPTGLALSPDGKTLYVTSARGGAAPEGHVQIIDAASAKVTTSLPAAHTPLAPVASPDGRFLYVCERFSGQLSIYNLRELKEEACLPVGREPVAAALTPDGRRLLIAHLLPEVPADAAVVAATVTVFDTATCQVVTRLTLPNGSSSVRGICLSPDGRYAYVTHILAHNQLPTTQLNRGWMNTAALTIIDVAGAKTLNTVLLDEANSGAANPWAVACSADGRFLCVTHSGSQELSVIDRPGLHERLTKVMAQPANAIQPTTMTTQGAQGFPLPAPNSVSDDFSFLHGLCQRVKLTGNGPRAVALVGNKAWIAEYFTDSLGVVQLAQPTTAAVARSLPLGPTAKPGTLAWPQTPARRGEMLFHDATICFQQWQSCASCHPDARADGFNWDLLNDGLGNPKNTKSMLLSHHTPPVMSTGIRETAEVAVRAGIKFILFVQRPEADAASIDEYLKSLQPVPSPCLEQGRLSASARRGKALFESSEVGCATCHSGPLFTSLRHYNVGTKDRYDGRKEFDTPTLIESWRTAPYLHDGRAIELKELFTKFNPENRHGRTSRLNDHQLDDLVEYVRSL